MGNYTIKEVMYKLKEYLSINVSGFKGASEEGLISYVNEVIDEIWSEFNLGFEQAIIVVPDKDTKVFKLATKNNSYDSNLSDDERLISLDKNVILGLFFQKLRKSSNNTSINNFIANIKINEGLI